MKETQGNEPQHFLSMPIEPGHTYPRVDPTEQRVLGIPLSWYRTRSPVDFSGFRHPIRWTRWHIEHHRLGPHAPDYQEYLTGPAKAKP